MPRRKQEQPKRLPSRKSSLLHLLLCHFLALPLLFPLRSVLRCFLHEFRVTEVKLTKTQPGLLLVWVYAEAAMLVMISPVPFLFSLSFSFFLSPPPLFFLEIGLFSLFPPPPPPHSGLLGGGGKRREEGSSVDAGFFFFFKSGSGGEVGEVGILKKKIPCGSQCLRVRGSGRAEGWGP